MAQTTSPDANDETSIKQTVASTLRSNDLACAVVERDVNGETVKDVYTAVEGEFALIKEFSPVPSKVKKFKLCSDLEDAQERGDDIEIVAQPELDIDVEAQVSKLVSTDEDEDSTSDPTPSSPSFDDKYDEVADDDALDSSAGPIGTSDVHGGGW